MPSAAIVPDEVYIAGIRIEGWGAQLVYRIYVWKNPFLFMYHYKYTRFIHDLYTVNMNY